MVGTLPQPVAPDEEEAVQRTLREQLSIFPVFLEDWEKRKYYQGCCKTQLWPLLHYMLPMGAHAQGRFDKDEWATYIRVNGKFCDVIRQEGLNEEEDLVWIHDYHLMALPFHLRRYRNHRVRCGLFLHSPFPSSEIFRAFPACEEVIRSMLNADLLGFHTFDYARHFLSCCSRMLGVEHSTKQGAITLEYFGRTVQVKVMPTGVNPTNLLQHFQTQQVREKAKELEEQFRGCQVVVGSDDLDIFKGIELKLQAVELLLDKFEEFRGRVCFVELINRPRSQNAEVASLQEQVKELVGAINARHGTASYQPVHWVQQDMGIADKLAYYAVADCALLTATRDGMNLMPYEYVVAREGAAQYLGLGEGEAGPDPASIVAAASTAAPPGAPEVGAPVRSTSSLSPPMDASAHSLETKGGRARTSSLVISEFVGCSPSLSGAARVNPWHVAGVADQLYGALGMDGREVALRHEKHWRYVAQHTVQFWAESFVEDLARLTAEHRRMFTIEMGLGLATYRVISLDADFGALEVPKVLDSYVKSSTRLLVLDYDGTLIRGAAINTTPPAELLALLRHLAADPANIVYILSGRRQQDLQTWFDDVPGLGLVAEHGLSTRSHVDGQWVVDDGGMGEADTKRWMEVVMPIMTSYTQQTDGSYIEAKASSLVWHYRNADPDFGQWQAKELTDQVEDLLVNHNVHVTKGKRIVEVKPKHTTKGKSVAELLAKHSPDMVLCVGDDRSDEEMFATVHKWLGDHVDVDGDKVYTCTVGLKPTQASYYLDSFERVRALLAGLLDNPEGGLYQGRQASTWSMEGNGSQLLHHLQHGGEH